jgi:hypothetical protein
MAGMSVEDSESPGIAVKFFKSRSFQLGAAALLGAAVVLATELCSPLLGRAIYERDFKAAYVDCAFAEQHTARFKATELKPSVRAQLKKALEVERLRCLDYAALNFRLRSFHVSATTISLIQLDAIAQEPQLQCDARCLTLLQ